MGKSTPKAPDPYKVADAQGAQNKEFAEYSAALNRINQTSPYGSISYTQNGTDPKTGAPIYSQNTSLSPELQGLFDSQIGSQKGISDAISGAIGRLPMGAFDASGINTDDIRKRSFDSQMASLQPKFDEGWRNLEGTLSDRGLPIGSEIATNEMNRYDRARNDSLLAASRQADLDASNEFQRQYGNKLTEYQLPLQQLSGLMGNSSSVQNPTFSPYAQASAASPDLQGGVWNAYNADVNAANQRNAQTGSAIAGAGQLALALLSDRRLKRDIKRIGGMASGLPIYSYKYLWSDVPQIGVMAQEALHYAPAAVSVHPSGFLQVHYGML